MSARPAGFFDLDRTVIRRSSALALAGAFRRRGLIGRRHLVKAAVWQLFFAARGASGETIRRGIDDGLAILRGLPDLPFLQAVGRSVAVNPDRRLLRVATARSWSVLRFGAPVPARDVA